jgi:glucan phosphoethanolaminetransferase (alkaline phosphatase superfamily)
MQRKSIKGTSRYLLTGSIVAVVLATTPYFFYTYEVVPDTEVWDNFFFTYRSGYYLKVQVSFWTIMAKFIPFYLMTIWFLTCKHWWYHTILIPMAMYGYQMIQAINDDILFMDKGEELAYIVPVVIASLSFTYLARIKVFDKINNIDISEIENYVKKPSDTFF